MVDNARITANFGISPLTVNQGLENELLTVRRSPERGTNSEGFQFSFNEIPKEKNLESKDPSPSPCVEGSLEVGEELTRLQGRMKEINLRLEQNLRVLNDKKQRNEKLKKLLDGRDIRSTIPTDSSFIDHRCACSRLCVIY